MGLANIRDVAKLAGVSPSTVSKYLNNPKLLRESNMKAVQSAIHKLNYTPNLLARNLRVQSSRTIAVVTQEIGNPFHATMYNRIRRDAQEYGYSVVLYSVSDVDGDIAAMFGAVPASYYSGMILCYLIDVPQAYEFALAHANVPSVVLSNNLYFTQAYPSVSSVFIDVKEGVFQAVEHLAGLGMRRIAFLGSAVRHPDLEPKIAGFRQALNRYGLQPFGILHLHQEFSVTAGYQLAEKLLGGQELPDAVMVDSDIIGMGAMRCLADHHIRVPQDMLLASCDDIELSSVYCPAFTTVHLPIEEASSAACALLLERIGKKPRREVPRFGASLVVRETTAR